LGLVIFSYVVSSCPKSGIQNVPQIQIWIENGSKLDYIPKHVFKSFNLFIFIHVYPFILFMLSIKKMHFVAQRWPNFSEKNAPQTLGGGPGPLGPGPWSRPGPMGLGPALGPYAGRHTALEY